MIDEDFNEPKCIQMKALRKITPYIITTPDIMVPLMDVRL
jgi:hypothetical protein